MNGSHCFYPKEQQTVALSFPNFTVERLVKVFTELKSANEKCFFFDCAFKSLKRLEEKRSFLANNYTEDSEITPCN